MPGILFGIFAYHVYVRGYWDIAYNFAVDEFGRIWEARAGGIDQPVMGAHAGGYNTESTGMVVLGNFTSLVPSPAALGALERALAWKLSLHGVPTLGRVTVEVDPSGAVYTAFAPGAHVSLPRVAGHRDGDTTSCPGNALYARLPSMRPQIAGLAGAPARLRIYSAPAAPVAAGVSTAIGGLLTHLAGGAGLADAPIELQSVGVHGVATTIATTMTDGNGAWSFTLTPAQNVMLRALHQPSPAAVSNVVVHLGGAGADLERCFRLAGGGDRHGLARAGRPWPSTCIGWPADGGICWRAGARLGRRRRSPPGSGSRKPGSYMVLARTAATARYVAGASPGWRPR